MKQSQAHNIPLPTATANTHFSWLFLCKLVQEATLVSSISRMARGSLCLTVRWLLQARKETRHRFKWKCVLQGTNPIQLHCSLMSVTIKEQNEWGVTFCSPHGVKLTGSGFVSEDHVPRQFATNSTIGGNVQKEAKALATAWPQWPTIKREEEIGRGCRRGLYRWSNGNRGRRRWGANRTIRGDRSQWKILQSHTNTTDTEIQTQHRYIMKQVEVAKSSQPLVCTTRKTEAQLTSSRSMQCCSVEVRHSEVRGTGPQLVTSSDRWHTSPTTSHWRRPRTCAWRAWEHIPSATTLQQSALPCACCFFPTNTGGTWSQHSPAILAWALSHSSGAGSLKHRWQSSGALCCSLA